MLKVGLTGNIGSGKTMVSKVFSSLGAPVFHADEEARKIYSRNDVTDSIRKAFGEQVFGPSGKLDRRALAGIVFNDEDKLNYLNSIIHPLVREKYREWHSGFSAVAYTIYEAAILFETGHYREMDRMICVSAPEWLRISRVTRRDGVTEQEVRQRMARQWSDEEKARLADFVIINDETQPVIPQVIKIHTALSSEF